MVTDTSFGTPRPPADAEDKKRVLTIRGVRCRMAELLKRLGPHNKGQIPAVSNLR